VNNLTQEQVHEHYKGARVLITGSTGFTGTVLTRKLADAGARITAIARNSSNIDALDDLDINWIRGEVFEQEVVDRAVEGVEYIFHLAAAFREEKGTDEGYRRVHLYSTQMLARAVQGRPEFKRFVHTSTVGVHGHIQGDDYADETYRFSPGDGYQRTKLEGEQWLAEYGAEHNLPYTIIRPTPIFGPGDRRLLKFFKMANKGYILMLGKGKGIYHLIHVDDLTEIFLRAGVLEQALSEIFIAANDEPISIIDMGQAIARALDKKIKVIRLPILPFFIGADICKAVCTPLGIQPPLYRRRVAFYTKDRKFNISKLNNVLGYHLKYTNESGLEKTAHWYVENGWL
jgi:nucleoside-diphosphate-sugar epimerase